MFNAVSDESASTREAAITVRTGIREVGRRVARGVRQLAPVHRSAGAAISTKIPTTFNMKVLYLNKIQLLSSIRDVQCMKFCIRSMKYYQGDKHISTLQPMTITCDAFILRTTVGGLVELIFTLVINLVSLEHHTFP